MLGRLHDVACQRDRAGNRKLHMDEYMTLLVMAMFNPMMDSLRTLQDASDLQKVRRKLGVSRFSIGSFSEASRLFDSDLVGPIIQQLLAELKVLPHDPRFDQIEQVVTLVDGSVLRAVSRMLWAKYQDDEHRAAKVHLQFELLKGVPVAAEITAANACERLGLILRLSIVGIKRCPRRDAPGRGDFGLGAPVSVGPDRARAV